MNDFTIVLPIKGTKEEMKFLQRSIRSAFEVNPGELLIALDKDIDLEIENKIKDIVHEEKSWGTLINIVKIERDPEWKFQLAKIVWECYSQAKYDKIFSYDVDSVLKQNMLIGKDLLKEDVALVSFTKQLHIASIGDLIRFIFYRIRVKTNESVFSGNYWVNRKMFFEIVDKPTYMNLINGVDTFLTERIRDLNYKMIMRKEMGVKALSKQNEDYDWRQFMDGVWYFANQEEIKKGAVKRGVIRRGFFLSHPKLLVFTKSFVYSRWGIWKGFNWAKKNAGSKTVGEAEKRTLYEWGYTGSTYLPKLKFKDTGTGHHEY